MSLIDLLNKHADKTPDEIVKTLNAPLHLTYEEFLEADGDEWYLVWYYRIDWQDRRPVEELSPDDPNVDIRYFRSPGEGHVNSLEQADIWTREEVSFAYTDVKYMRAS